VVLIRLLGSFEVVAEDVSISRFGSRKAAGVLAYLAYHLGEDRRREHLVDLFWPDFDEARGSHCLSLALSLVRRALDQLPEGGRDLIRSDGRAVRLVANGIGTDVAAFQEALKAAAELPSGQERFERLLEAARHYRGELLPSSNAGWVEAERQCLLGRALQALHEAARWCLSSGQGNLALELSQRAIHLDPEDDRAREDLVRAYLAVGARRAALREYETLRALLQSEYGTEPNPQLVSALAAHRTGH
jgi:DNA-binding SARP family transcriptional activator